ncbi:SIS domain-containing protein [Lentilactobacillus hilgardii]|uniref:SIS domain-containing protein n=1 Tax=Lentilactobacillus hilgardii TaxID=1588 RepID=UPI0021C3C354|nr:SIS domain-containing protein [Lentilactobacillus hilgardii]MCP9334380.1 SIS domain-containing protein [Lentilactobacillus hilgardii]MCP9350964.1 SIS domain-containing protein [Lentilactobacillus hilgardii]MCP9353845.1 SIS domain-containing protein [Lentilactobacillus hilgardii]
MNLIQKYIQETPSQLKEIIKGSQELFRNVVNRNIERIIITGSGTSYHSGTQMQQLMREKSGIVVDAYYPFYITPEFLKGSNAKTLFVGISQGGSSFTTYDAMKVAKSQGCTIASMAGEKNAYIDELADEILTVNIGEEKAGAKTKGYYATKLNLLLLAEYIGLHNGTLNDEIFNQDMQKINETLEVFPDAYESAFSWVNEHKNTLAEVDNIRVVGPGTAYGDVLESALKLLETCRVPVTGYEFNEFIHGIYNAIDDKSTVFFLDDGTEPRLTKMLEVLGQWTNRLYVVDFSKVTNKHKIGYSVQVPSNMQTFIFPLAFQIMASILPELRGVDPSKPKDPKFHMELGSKRYNH